jgi:hypothetical protein
MAQHQLSGPRHSGSSSGRNQHQAGKLSMLSSRLVVWHYCSHCWNFENASVTVDIIPDLSERLQQYFDQGVRQKDIPTAIARDLPGITVRYVSQLFLVVDLDRPVQVLWLSAPSSRNVRCFIKQFSIENPRHSSLTDIKKGLAVLELRESDPLNHWGCQKVKEKLRLNGVHLTRWESLEFLALWC